MTHVQKDTAVLLKEKGFNLKEVCDWMYIEDSEQTFEALKQPNRHEGHYSAPYYQTVLEWLRAKGVHVCVVPVNLWQQWRMFIYIDSYPPQKTRIPNKPMDYPTHDLALEAGIVHALKHYVI